MIERVKTGIKGFDNLIEGGFPKGFVVLLSGTPGTGKTLFSLEYLYNGVMKFGERGMLITLEQNLADVRSQAEKIGINLANLEKKGSLILMHIPSTALNAHTIDEIKKEVKKRKVQRLVVDSLSTLAINAPIYTPIKDIALRDIMNYKAFFSPPILGNFVVKRFVHNFICDLKDIGCTTLVTAESPEKGEYLSRDTVSEFLCDAVILLTFESMGGDYSRNLLVRKMRNTSNNEDIHPLEITGKGIVIHTLK
ncbi:MAG TPA: ATPase domain-containing protein [Candidatus Nanoarchaeia archaeon]|nr:ATPase domain-containing protein [Candidatus Nanoarchaeia archaeon]